MKIGYGRVSTQDQKLEFQLDTLKSYGCKSAYKEKYQAKLNPLPRWER